jgi:hypothetical protein
MGSTMISAPMMIAAPTGICQNTTIRGTAAITASTTRQCRASRMQASRNARQAIATGIASHNAMNSADTDSGDIDER